MNKIKLPTHLKQLVDILPKGAENARTASDIAKLFVPKINERTVLDYKAKAISLGVPIGSSRNNTNPGLFIIESEEERTAVIRVLSGQIRSETKVLDDLAQAGLNFEVEA